MSDEFDEDWEGQYLLHEFSDEDSPSYQEEPEEYEAGEEYPDSPGLNIDPSDWSRIGFGKQTEDIFKTGKEKALRDPRSVSLNQMRGVLSSSSYREISKDYKDEAYALAENLPDKQFILYNIDILTAAALFTVLYRKKGGLTKNNITSFLKTTGNLPEINQLDFIRYARILGDL